MSSLIYGLYDPSFKEILIRYVGYSGKTLQSRLTQHIYESKIKNSNHKHKWIRSLLDKKVTPKIIEIEVVSEENWQEREIFWINKLSGNRLVNSTSGGEGLINPSADVRAAISLKVSLALKGNQYRKGIPHSINSKKKISDGLLNSEKAKAANNAKIGVHSYTPSQETREKISRANKGRKGIPLTEHQKMALLIANTGRKHSQQEKDKRTASLIGNQRALGMIHSEKSKLAISQSRIGGKWVNDGVSVKFLKFGEALKDGWRYGTNINKT